MKAKEAKIEPVVLKLKRTNGTWFTVVDGRLITTHGIAMPEYTNVLEHYFISEEKFKATLEAAKCELLEAEPGADILGIDAYTTYGQGLRLVYTRPLTHTEGTIYKKKLAEMDEKERKRQDAERAADMKAVARLAAKYSDLNALVEEAKATKKTRTVKK